MMAEYLRFGPNQHLFRVSQCAPELYPDFGALLRSYLRDTLLSVEDAEAACVSFGAACCGAVGGGTLEQEVERMLIEHLEL